MTHRELLEIVDDALSELPAHFNDPATNGARVALVNLGRALLRRLGDNKPDIDGAPV